MPKKDKKDYCARLQVYSQMAGYYFDQARYWLRIYEENRLKLLEGKRDA
jgi:hypothetical protein